jgi:hypothetical protein
MPAARIGLSDDPWLPDDAENPQDDQDQDDRSDDPQAEHTVLLVAGFEAQKLRTTRASRRTF